MIYFFTNQTEIDTSSTEITLINTTEEVFKIIEKMPGDVAIDSETTGFDPYTCQVLTWQFGDRENQLVIDMTPNSAWMLVKTIFNSLLTNRLFLLQNAKFDLRFLMKEGIYLNNIYDTFLAEQVLYNGIKFHKKALDALVERYTDGQVDKSIRGNIHKVGLTYQVIKYAADDVKYLHDIRDKQMELIIEKDLERVLSLENQFVSVLAYTELCGMPIDHDKWLKKCEEDLKLRDEAIEAMNNWLVSNTGQQFLNPQLDIFGNQSIAVNWASPQQVIPVMKEQGLDLKVKDKDTGKLKDSVDAKVLLPQINKSPIVPLYLAYSKADKVVTTYGKEFLKSANKATGRIHTSYTQIRDTGRISSGDKQQKLPNLQNIPATPKRKDRMKDIYERECFVPEEGKVFIDCDYSSQESVILANFSLEPNLLEFYRSGASDLHSFVAAKLYPKEIGDTPLEKVKDKYPSLRQNAKAANFAIAYGGNGSTIANNLSVPVEVGDQVEKAYFEAFPQLKDYFHYQKTKALKLGYVLINQVSGRKTFVDNWEQFVSDRDNKFTPEYWRAYREAKESGDPKFEVLREEVSSFFRKKGAIERMALNYPIQGTAGDQTKLAGIYLYNKIRENGDLGIIKIVNFIHDEILLEVPEDRAEYYSYVLKECMESAALVFCDVIELKAEPVISKLWEH